MKLDERVMDILNEFVHNLQEQVRPTVEENIQGVFWRKTWDQTVEIATDDTVSLILYQFAEKLVSKYFDSNSTPTPSRDSDSTS